MMTIKKTIATGMMFCAAMAPVMSPAADADLNVALYSAYVWRGQVLNDEAVLQPYFNAATPWGLTLGAWGNLDLTQKYENRSEFTEIDLTADYKLPFSGPVGVNVGVTEYTFPKEGDWTDEEGKLVAHDLDTREIYAAVSGDVLLSPTLTVYVDVDEIRDYYGMLGISHDFDLVDKLSLNLAASIGMGGGQYNDLYFSCVDEEGKEYDAGKAALNDGNVSAGLTYAFTEAFSLGAKLAYTMLLNEDVRDAAEVRYGDKDRVYGALTADYTF